MGTSEILHWDLDGYSSVLFEQNGEYFRVISKCHKKSLIYSGVTDSFSCWVCEVPVVTSVMAWVPAGFVLKSGENDQGDLYRWMSLWGGPFIDTLAVEVQWQ